MTAGSGGGGVTAARLAFLFRTFGIDFCRDALSSRFFFLFMVFLCALVSAAAEARVPELRKDVVDPPDSGLDCVAVAGLLYAGPAC